MTNTSPFVPGARVAVQSAFGDNYREGFVEKVRKNGNFTLKGSAQQWRPWRTSFGVKTWRATETGSGYSRRTLRFWNEETDAEIQEQTARTKRRGRWNVLFERIRRLRPDDLTDAALDQIEAALPPKDQSHS